MEDVCDFNSRITLIKVPKFLADQWRANQDKTILGYYKKDELDSIEQLYVRCEGTMRRFLCRKSELSCPTAVQIKGANIPITSMGRFKACITAYPTIDLSYKNKLKERSMLANARKERIAVNTESMETVQDRSATLFKYYNPRGDALSSAINVTEGDALSRKKQETPYSRSKAKVTKREAMDMDELKMAIFKIFDTDEGREGLQFKRICQLINQPPASVKAAIDEITEQRKRASDHKVAYFLRNHFNQEEKKSILHEHLNRQG